MNCDVDDKMNVRCAGVSFVGDGAEAAEKEFAAGIKAQMRNKAIDGEVVEQPGQQQIDVAAEFGVSSDKTTVKAK